MTVGVFWDGARGKVVTMKRSLSDFAARLRAWAAARAAKRRKRDLTRAAEETKTYEEMTSRDWQGEPLDLHIVPLAGRRNPRGRDGRRL